MFYALTASGKWLAEIPIPSFVVTFLSAYKLQSLRVATPYLSRLKPVADVSKVLLPSKSPAELTAYSSAYNKIVYSSLKVAKAFKEVLLNKKTTAILSAISTASLLIGGTALGGFPIILCATGSAFAAYRAEQRKEAIQQAGVGTVSVANSYDQGTGPKSKGITYPWPHPMEIVDKALNLAATGIIFGTSSVGFALAIAKVTLAVIAEVKNYSSISSLKKQALEAGKEISEAAKAKPEEQLNKDTQTQTQSKPPAGPARGAAK